MSATLLVLFERDCMEVIFYQVFMTGQVFGG